VIGIKVISENIKTHQVKHTNTSYFTMVAFGDDNKTTQVPALLLQNQTQARRFYEAAQRKENKSKNKKEESLTKTERSTDQYMAMLSTERCRLM